MNKSTTALPKRVRDLHGQVFDRLTVTEFAGVWDGVAHWHCACSCGGSKTVPSRHLVTATTRSCGCLRFEQVYPEPPNIEELIRRYQTDTPLRDLTKEFGVSLKLLRRWFAERNIPTVWNRRKNRLNPDMLVCSRCHRKLLSEEFSDDPVRPCGKQSQCRECVNKRNRKRYAKQNATPDGREYHRHRQFVRVLRRYGLSLEQYEAMRDAQGNVCAICGRAPEEVDRWGNVRRLPIDHDARTGKVRALLCSHCNKGIGCFFENTALLAKAIEYLRLHSDS